MPDTRKHRGPHPADAKLFGNDRWDHLQHAVGDLSWLLTRSYSATSALKLVGDRFNLTQRQRLAVMRSSCSDQARNNRMQKQISAENLAGNFVSLDGFNVLTTIEAALAGGVILDCRDGCYRDMAGMHGSYRKVEETKPALTLIGETLYELGATECRWYFDSPVSNSGRISRVVRELASASFWEWETELHTNPDAVLIQSSDVVASADSYVLDGCRQWVNLAREVIDRHIPQARIVPMSDVNYSLE